MAAWNIRHTRAGTVVIETGGCSCRSLRLTTRQARALSSALVTAAAREDEWLRQKREQALERFADNVGLIGE